ncbi:DUF1292 domain-containing protein [Paenibacillus sp. Marseille-Q4541]|uniref:DUF1292 domain-containing protein n=1 Tax=Paenibacillus sp. Marseille-Q4541 TaxID=2831522 RepID=UPI001BA80826|nr:DUF1292 domain-containing protein [Paenibacillus sp. Marseille-Q4541]
MSDHNHVHDENCNHDHDHEPQVLIFEDENGQEVEMILVQTFDVDDKEYAVFVERNNPEEDGLILRFEEENDEVSLYQIEDEDEWKRVEAAFNKMVEEQE